MFECIVLQIVFGVCGDYLGRKKIYLLTLFIIIVATLGQAMAASTVFGTSLSAAIAASITVCLFELQVSVNHRPRAQAFITRQINKL